MQQTLRPFYYLIGFLVCIWVIQIINLVTGDMLLRFGLLPRELGGLDGLVASPFLHGSFAHVSSNTLGLAILGGLVSVHGQSTFVRVSLFVALVGGLATWVLARHGNHIGASGLVFGYFGYLVARGLIERTAKALVIAAIVAIVYSGLLWGVLPSQKGVSWEAHLFGFLAGLLAAKWRIHHDAPEVSD